MSLTKTNIYSVTWEILTGGQCSDRARDADTQTNPLGTGVPSTDVGRTMHLLYPSGDRLRPFCLILNPIIGNLFNKIYKYINSST